MSHDGRDPIRLSEQEQFDLLSVAARQYNFAGPSPRNIDDLSGVPTKLELAVERIIAARLENTPRPAGEQRLEALRLLVKFGDTRTTDDADEPCLLLEDVQRILAGQPIEDRADVNWLPRRWWESVNAALAADLHQPTKWWRVLDEHDALWCETSDEGEARQRWRPGDRLQRLYSATVSEWRDES